ncbi:tRNA (guanine-N(7)-)-methyltransferase [Perkinsela sp. CCAP 1560/4]|nr:tRNA (guanine-N(7)-)-methyltransferase [Perkinsela sp. CCAP 1560/4]|eukprot:KNH08072.1 tRNA (guanine-N(7)-)-methyltransferase [Perkinsela sp. CCAP 1560/4]
MNTESMEFTVSLNKVTVLIVYCDNSKYHSISKKNHYFPFSFWEIVSLFVLSLRARGNSVKILLVRDYAKSWIDVNTEERKRRNLITHTNTGVCTYGLPSLLITEFSKLSDGSQIQRSFKKQPLELAIICGLCFLNRISCELEINDAESKCFGNCSNASDGLQGEIVCILPHWENRETGEPFSLNVGFCASKKKIPISFICLHEPDKNQGLDDSKTRINSIYFLSNIAFLTKGEARICSYELLLQNLLRLFAENKSVYPAFVKDGSISRSLSHIDSRVYCTCHQECTFIGRMCSKCSTVYCEKYSGSRCEICWPRI